MKLRSWRDDEDVLIRIIYVATVGSMVGWVVCMVIVWRILELSRQL